MKQRKIADGKEQETKRMKDGIIELDKISPYRACGVVGDKKDEGWYNRVG